MARYDAYPRRARGGSRRGGMGYDLDFGNWDRRSGLGGGPRYTGMESNRWRGGYGSDYRDSPRGGMRGYDRDPRHGYGSRGLYGGSMYGGGRYGREYLGAWAPGGWSSEHGRSHSGLRDTDRYGYDYRRFSDEAPTG